MNTYHSIEFCQELIFYNGLFLKPGEKVEISGKPGISRVFPEAMRAKGWIQV